jgi:sec-independent protein translocase protein TatB
MFDIGVTKIALIGAVALLVIGPEKLPKLARTLGALLGKAQRYVSDVKAEVSRSMELDELKKMKESMEGAARDVQSAVNDAQSSVQTAATDFEKDWADATGQANRIDYASPPPVYSRPKKNWRIKTGATPNWYKARNGIRTKALSGAARVARFRPHRPA